MAMWMGDEHVGLSNHTYFLSYWKNYCVRGGFVVLDECPTRWLVPKFIHNQVAFI